jgi:hypothetical protein
MLFINAINSQRANEQVSNIPHSRLKVKGDSKNRILKTINECNALFFLPAA